MHASTTPATTGFKRQIVVRIGQEDWPLLEAAVQEHGSIQAAMLAGLHTLKPTVGEAAAAAPTEEAPAVEPALAKPARPPRLTKPRVPRPSALSTTAEADDPDEEIPARHAAQLLGLKSSTISGYIRGGRLAGRHDGAPSWRGWLTTRAAVAAYRRKRG